jgi:predicted SAM-dependent methyltransferase
MSIQKYLDTHSFTKIQLGCGGNFFPDWLDTDVTLYDPKAVYMDITKPFPIADSKFDRVYSEHAIEHITYWQGQHMLQESYRILKSGGRIRISCPDFQFLLDLYSNPCELATQYIKDTKPEWAPYPNKIFTFNNFVRDWGHQFIYDKECLTNSLLAAGFVNVTEHRVRESDDEHFKNLEADWRMTKGFLQLETMTLEAEKPL